MKTKHPTLSDSEIIRQSIASPWMFSLLVDRYQKLFLQKSLTILRSKDAAEDAVQETFLKIYKNASRFVEQDGASFSSWAYKILLNTCYDEVSRRKKTARVESFDFADLDISGSIESDDGGTKSFVHSILLKMPKNLSRFLTLYFLEERTQKEIAESEQISLIAVRSRIHRAKKSFRELALQMI